MSDDDAELLDALRGGNARQTEDVLLILTALKEGATLVTKDKSALARARRRSVSTMTVEQLRDLVSGGHSYGRLPAPRRRQTRMMESSSVDWWGSPAVGYR